MIKYSLYLTKKQLKTLRELAKDGIKVAEHIRRAIDLYLSTLEKGNKQ